MLATELKQRQQGLPQQQQQPMPQREASSLDTTNPAKLEEAPLDRLGSTPGTATI
jgi:hypothetical protein